RAVIRRDLVASVVLTLVAAALSALSQLASFGAAYGRETTQVHESTVRRVLVISLPATSWADIKAGDDPNLRQLVADSAVANMVTRTAGRRSSIDAGYTAFGAGGRASAA